MLRGFGSGSGWGLGFGFDFGRILFTFTAGFRCGFCIRRFGFLADFGFGGAFGRVGIGAFRLATDFDLALRFR